MAEDSTTGSVHTSILGLPGVIELFCSGDGGRTNKGGEICSNPQSDLCQSQGGAASNLNASLIAESA